MWGLQRGTSIIPKSVTPLRIETNFRLDGWELTKDEMEALDGIKTRFKVVNDSWMPIKVFFGDDERLPRHISKLDAASDSENGSIVQEL